MRQDNQSVADYYAQKAGFNTAKTEQEANLAATTALNKCVDAGLAFYKNYQNGSELRHVYIFLHKEDEPTFKLPYDTEIYTPTATPRPISGGELEGYYLVSSNYPGNRLDELGYLGFPDNGALYQKGNHFKKVAGGKVIDEWTKNN